MSRRFFRHGELPLVLLALVAEQPRHGYQIMGELDRLFGPDYRPSPGSVYPAVDALQAEGLIAGEVGHGKTTYHITAAGEEALATRSDGLLARTRSSRCWLASRPGWRHSRAMSTAKPWRPCSNGRPPR
jgi:DNA-binding PadR family transcriptional regulator